jgi:N-methylhydantoinase A
MALWVGVDVGGTFTDIHGFDEITGRSFVYKVPSTPGDPSQAILAGVQGLLQSAGFAAADLVQLAHGTTVATNALIQRKGARVALVTTKGFRDLLEIGRQTRPFNYDMHTDFPPPVVPRRRRFEVSERILADGIVLTALTDEDVSEAVAAVAGARVEAVAVCLVFAYLSPEHERRIGEALRRELSDVFISLSSEVQPEFREYERFSTTALNAFLQPLMARYLQNLGVLAERRLDGVPVAISQSSGGLMSIDQARRFPIRSALSGPAAGVVGAIDTARRAGRPNLITFDMGGTSADVAMVRDYEIGQSYNRRIGGYPVRLPMVDINTIGAGGGSIAWFGKDELLKVGPISAGAVPGPACYGAGGMNATVTDANLLLGRLSEGGLLGGRMRLDAGKARTAIEPIASRLGIGVEKAALGILEIVVSNMVRAIRAISVERGYDPRELTLLAFGGAGPLHARDVAESLEMREILVPEAPGILCAAGLIASDLKENFVRTRRLELAVANAEVMARDIADLTAEAGRWFDREKVAMAERELAASLDLRYVGQNFELSIPVPGGASGTAPKLPAIDGVMRLFWAAHDRSYGYHNPHDPVELVNIRLVARRRRQFKAPPAAPVSHRRVPEAVGRRQVWFFAGGPHSAAIFDRARLEPGQTIAGPAIVEQMDSTTPVYPGDTLRVDNVGNLLIEIRR